MQVVGVFKKVSLDQFIIAAEGAGFDANQSEATYEKIRKPKRSTWGSAGYDFFSPFSFQLNPGESILIPTGVRVLMDNGWVLNIAASWTIRSVLLTVIIRPLITKGTSWRN